MTDRQQSRTRRVAALLLRLAVRFYEWRAKECPVCDQRMSKLTAPYGYTCLNKHCRAYRCNYPAAKMEERGIRVKDTYER